MCGILGLIELAGYSVTHKKTRQLTDRLFVLAESRGKEASGFATKMGAGLTVYKTNQSIRYLVKSAAYKKTLGQNQAIKIIGHSRLVTDGRASVNINNQPFVKHGIAGVHNGIIVNKDQIWEKYLNENRESELDSELIPTLLSHFFKEGDDIGTSLKKMYGEFYGMTTIALFFEATNHLLLATNNGALYYLPSRDHSVFIFSSESIMLKKAVQQANLNAVFDTEEIVHMTPGRACSVNLSSLKIEDIDFQNGETFSDWNVSEKGVINDISEPDKHSSHNFVKIEKEFAPNQEFTTFFRECENHITDLTRCNKCVLPKTFPFIDYDEEGTCNFCRSYHKLKFKGADIFEKRMENHRRNDGKPDCIVSFSGGRDSCFSLHYIKKVLDLNPIAYSYDWGMVTDLARRNQARLCDKLGVEHIYISADIPKKRKNIQRNVLAWLKWPNLGTIPLFMAGDKQYFYYANKLRKDYQIDALIMGDNMLESTNFKTGFCGIKPVFDREKNYHIPLMSKFKMLGFYSKEYLSNPSYLNRSLLDTTKAFLSYYFIPHNFINIFDYIEWKQPMIEKILFDEYDWEISPHTSTTWRIGDGTAAFYNYIYYTVAGFTENDTFRSNQIREGHITREEGLKKATEENKAQWNNIKWYCDTIDIDFDETIKIINQIPKLYKK